MLAVHVLSGAAFIGLPPEIKNGAVLIPRRDNDNSYPKSVKKARFNPTRGSKNWTDTSTAPIAFPCIEFLSWLAALLRVLPGLAEEELDDPVGEQKVRTWPRP
jgi:hypothetical protein